MGIIAYVIFGLIAGSIANFIEPGKAQGGILGSIVLGIIGAVVGGFLGQQLFGVGVSGFNITSEDIKKDYYTIRKELEQFSKSLIEKKEILLLTKKDLISEKEIQQKIKIAKKLNPDVLTVSVVDEISIQRIKDFINNQK